MMVGSGTVKNDASTLNNYLNSVKTEMSGLQGIWSGTSYNSISSQVESFLGEYGSIITQMESFAQACDEYERYIGTKTQISQLQNQQAAASDNAKSSFNEPLAQLNSNLRTITDNINKCLAAALTPRLSATALAGSGNIQGLTPSTPAAGSTSEANKQLIESVLLEDGKTVGDYSGFTDGNWCADFVSEMLNRNGYDVEPSSIAGHVDGGSIFQNLKAAGATFHLDSASQYYDGDNSEFGEYDPNYSPQPGDVVLFDFEPDGTTDHVGFVVKDNGDGTIMTIEGNTYGDAGGSCVAVHESKDRSQIYGYATPVKKS